jgi:hypothetical protein
MIVDLIPIAQLLKIILREVVLIRRLRKNKKGFKISLVTKAHCGLVQVTRIVKKKT